MTGDATVGIGPTLTAPCARMVDGALVVDAVPAPPDCDLGAWTGCWIWPAASAGAPVPCSHWDARLTTGEAEIRGAWFRRCFVPKTHRNLSKAWLRITADSWYRVWIDGRLIARGPAPIGGSYAMAGAPAWWYEDVFDLGRLLTTRREHLIAVEVLAGPEDPTRFSRGIGALRCEIRDPAQGVVLASDHTWQACDARGYGGGANRTGLTRRQDLQHWPRSWYRDHDACREWPAAVVVAADRRCRRHCVPPLAECLVHPCQVIVPFAEHRARFSAPEAFTSGEGVATITPGPTWLGYLVLPTLLTGHLQLIAEGSPGTRIRIGAQEVPGQDEGPVRSQELRLGADPVVFESVGTFVARVLELEVTIPPGGELLRIERLALLAQTQPVTARGAFACSDSGLTRLWSTARHNLQLCLQQIHLDSPHHQEPLGDHGDYLVEAQMAYAAFGPYALIREDIRRMAADLDQHDGTTFHTTYALLLPDLVADFLRHDGDADTARAAMPAIRKTLVRTLSWLGPTGLVSEAPNYMFVDWVEHHGANYHHPPAAQGIGPLTSFTVRALRVAADLCRRLDTETDLVPAWTEAAEKLAAAFRRELVTEDGVVIDGRAGLTRVQPSRWLPGDGPDRVASKHGAVLAVWAGILDEHAGRAALLRVLDRADLPDPQPYFAHYLFDAFDRTGLFAERARTWLDRWLAMLGDHPHSLREMWDRGDYSHAWGGTPLVQLSRRVLGVEVSSADPPRARIRPHLLAGLWHCAGRVPVGMSTLHVAWHRDGDDIEVTYWTDGPVEVTVREDQLAQQIRGEVRTTVSPDAGRPRCEHHAAGGTCNPREAERR